MEKIARRIKRVNHSFGPEKRVKRRSEFLEIQSSGRKFKTKNFIFIAKNSSASRIGITVTTKVHKRAVVRNKLKRQIREIYRRLFSYLESTQDIVVIAYQGAIELSYLEIKKEINYAFRKMGLLEQKIR